MAADDREQNAGTAFPLTAFAERVYTMRVKDEPSLPEAEYPAEVAALTRHKMAVPLQLQDGSGKLVKQWRFRHDKVSDFFVVQTFLGQDNTRPEGHLGDPRFRRVYFLLAEILPLKDARRLREVLIQHAADTKDHSVSDDFVRRLRVREPAGPGARGPGPLQQTPRAKRVRVFPRPDRRPGPCRSWRARGRHRYPEGWRGRGGTGHAPCPERFFHRWPLARAPQAGEGYDLRLRAQVPSTGQLLRWLLGAGDNVEVVAPAELRHVVAVQTAKMAAMYGSG